MGPEPRSTKPETPRGLPEQLSLFALRPMILHHLHDSTIVGITVVGRTEPVLYNEA